MPNLSKISRKVENEQRASSKQIGLIYLKVGQGKLLSHLTITFGWHLSKPCVFGSSSVEPPVSNYASSEGTLHPGTQFPRTQEI